MPETKNFRKYILMEAPFEGCFFSEVKLWIY
nr:MAG TPA: hypothetical protein [Caudoviricetes sp.]